MSENDYSCIEVVEETVHVALPMSYVGNAVAGVKEYLERWKCQYVSELDGLVVDFKNVTFVTPRARIINDQPYLHYDIKAEFSLFKPGNGKLLKGTVNRISKEHVGCVVLSTINASIQISDDISSEIFSFVGIDSVILFEVSDYEVHKKIIRVNGKFTNESIALTKELFPNQCTSHVFFDSDDEKIENSVSEQLPNIDQPEPVKSRKRKHKSRNSVAESSMEVESVNIKIEADETILNDSAHAKPRKKKRKRDADVVSSDLTFNDEYSGNSYNGIPDGGRSSLISESASRDPVNLDDSNITGSGSKKKKKKSKNKELQDDSFEVNYENPSPHKKRKKSSKSI